MQLSPRVGAPSGGSPGCPPDPALFCRNANIQDTLQQLEQEMSNADKAKQMHLESTQRLEQAVRMVQRTRSPPWSAAAKGRSARRACFPYFRLQTSRIRSRPRRCRTRRAAAVLRRLPLPRAAAGHRSKTGAWALGSGKVALRTPALPRSVRSVAFPYLFAGPATRMARMRDF